MFFNYIIGTVVFAAVIAAVHGLNKVLYDCYGTSSGHDYKYLAIYLVLVFLLVVVLYKWQDDLMQAGREQVYEYSEETWGIQYSSDMISEIESFYSED